MSVGVGPPFTPMPSAPGDEGESLAGEDAPPTVQGAGALGFADGESFNEVERQCPDPPPPPGEFYLDTGILPGHRLKLKRASQLLTHRSVRATLTS